MLNSRNLVWKGGCSVSGFVPHGTGCCAPARLSTIDPLGPENGSPTRQVKDVLLHSPVRESLRRPNLWANLAKVPAQETRPRNLPKGAARVVASGTRGRS